MIWTYIKELRKNSVPGGEYADGSEIDVSDSKIYPLRVKRYKDKSKSLSLAFKWMVLCFISSTTCDTNRLSIGLTCILNHHYPWTLWDGMLSKPCLSGEVNPSNSDMLTTSVTVMLVYQSAYIQYFSDACTAWENMIQLWVKMFFSLLDIIWLKFR